MSEAAFISLGSNIDPFENLPAAIAALRDFASALDVSRVYRSPAVGPTRQPDFYNAGARIWTSQEPLALRAALRAIEASLGRIRTEDKFAPRTIDLDLIIQGSRLIQGDEFTLPDPDLLHYGHLAIPLAEIDPEFNHPITNEALRAIAESLRPSAELQLDQELSEIIQKISRQTR